ncbi:MAG: GNAT family N-acetyltransferase, partial [Luteitalea sp.]
MVNATRAAFSDIRPLRALYLRELDAQMRYDSVHDRGWSDLYLLRVGDTVVGYGAVMGQEKAHRDTIFEWYVVPPWRAEADAVFAALAA